MSDFEKTDLNKVKRIPKRGAYDKATIYPIIDEALICHVGLVQDGRPIVIPTIHARIDDCIYIHGASTSRLMNSSTGTEVCITITHLDGLVLARSSFNHSMNYRSAVIFGKGILVEDIDEKNKVLAVITDKLVPTRWDDARKPTATELKATHVIKIPIDLASAKIRIGDPGDNKEDYDLDVWAGVIPMRTVFGDVIPDPVLREGIPVPEYVEEYVKTKK